MLAESNRSDGISASIAYNVDMIPAHLSQRKMWRIVALFLMILLCFGVTEAQEGVGLYLHTVQPGETLASVAQSAGTTVAVIQRINALAEETLQTGQELWLPARHTAIEHRVQPGDTLYGIAALYGLDAAEIAALNDMELHDLIYVDQLLRLRVVSVDLLKANPFTLVHSVQPGETLSAIVRRYDVPFEQLILVNEIEDPSLLYVGAELRIPGWEILFAPKGLPSVVEAIDLRPTPLREGETARLWIRTDRAFQVSVRFLGKDYPAHAVENGREHFILLSVPVFTEAALEQMEVTLLALDENEQHSFILQAQVLASHFGEESINLLADRLNLLDAELEAAENERIRSIMSGVQPWRSFGGGMKAPVAGSVISDFGTRRSYNGGPFDRFHSGTDFTATLGAPVFAAAPGVVVMAERLAVRGLATIIDHGWGVYTGYWHQDSLAVGVGQTVNVGQIIGVIGNTGRVSGVHLHWELWVNGVPVNPLQWLEEVFP